MFSRKTLTAIHTTVTNIEAQLPKLDKALTELTRLLTALKISQMTTTAKIEEILKASRAERDNDRQFMTHVLNCLLRAQQPQRLPVVPNKPYDPFEELPLGDPAGYSNEELGLTPNAIPPVTKAAE